VAYCTKDQRPRGLAAAVRLLQTDPVAYLPQMPIQQTARPDRKNIRYRCNQRLCVRYRAEGQEFIAYGRCTIVGRGGIGALLPGVELELGQVVTLEIALSTPAAPSVLRAQLKNCRGQNYGFQFLEGDGRVAAVLEVLFRPEEVVAFTVSR